MEGKERVDGWGKRHVGAGVRFNITWKLTDLFL